MKYFVVFAALVSVAMAVALPSRPVPMTLHELSEAIQDPSTDPALLPLLEQALNQMMAAIVSGHEVESVMVPLPVIVPGEVAPVAPAVVSEAGSASPLVQIIVNINKQAEQAEELVPEPVSIVDRPVPEVNPIDVIAVGAPEVNPADILHPVPVPAGSETVVGPIV